MQAWRETIGVLWLSAMAAGSAARSDPLPVIVTYEMSKAKIEARALAHDPKGFWIREIMTRLEDKKPDSHQFKHPMSIAVTFVVDRTGKVVSKEVTRSSGDPAVDKEALAVLDRAAPFPPMPAALPDDHLAFTMPMRFK